jgi:hypothetical protein
MLAPLFAVEPDNAAAIACKSALLTLFNAILPALFIIESVMRETAFTSIRFMLAVPAIAAPEEFSPLCRFNAMAPEAEVILLSSRAVMFISPAFEITASST